MHAIILGSPVLQTARVISHWLAAGHTIEEIWVSHNIDRVNWRRDKYLSYLAPTWSVTNAARTHGIPIRRVAPLRKSPTAVREGCKHGVDVLLSSIFPYAVPDDMLNYYSGRAVNLHPALLPQFAGPCPMFGMVANERMEASGITLHQMTTEFDAGAVIAQQPVAWPEDHWYRTWDADLADTAGKLASSVLPDFLSGKIRAKPQSGNANYCQGVDASLLTVDERVTQRRATWLGASLGRIMPLSISTENGAVAVSEVDSVVDAPTSRPPRVTRFHVECDVADARIRFRRWTSLRRKIERARDIVALTNRPLAA